MHDIAIIGSGGHGREVLQVVLAAQRAGLPVAFHGFFDDSPDRALLERFGWPLLGSCAAAAQFSGQLYVAVGNPALKTRLAEGINAAPALVHPMADLGVGVDLAPGAVVFGQSTVTTNVAIGRHTHIGRGAAIGHDSVLEDFVSVMPLASISGNVHIGHGTYVGTGALVRQGVVLGAGCTVGMGAVVLDDVAPGTTVVGNPAKPLVKA